ncbi:MAG: SMP-30/gluconolactonase/LRE family protein [Chitinophagaceae bacterium]|nr:MAG: SMP-30/gluconolactonase/LRE family protein [Chitinophagaceae bacterium]
MSMRFITAQKFVSSPTLVKIGTFPRLIGSRSTGFFSIINLLAFSTAVAKADVSAIPGVLAEGAKLEFIKEGFEGTEGPIGLEDGSLIFTETRANRVTRIAEDGSTSIFLENTNGTNGLAFNKKGELVSVQNLQPKIGVVYPAGKEKIWVESYEGKAFQRPNDLVINKKGGVYFTDIGVLPKGENTTPARPAVYYVTSDGKISQVASDIARPNGIQLSRDEKTLYVANTAGEHVLAYKVLDDGKLGEKREFAKLEGFQKTETGELSSGADGLAIDDKGRLYVASNAGIQVFDDKGGSVGVIPVPHKPQNLAFAGKDKKTLYIVGRGAAYKVPVLTPGFKGRAK